tara:strand:+ start:1178 stop:1612 length:435 start_codon:yes stop_codon:yes gene_type:complete
MFTRFSFTHKLSGRSFNVNDSVYKKLIEQILNFIMGKMFPIAIIAVAIIGFSSSAYFFSSSEISIENPVSIETQSSNSVMDEIEECIEENLAGGSISLNSFNTNMLLTLKEAASEAKTDSELDEIRERLHNLTDCKPNNQGFIP